MDIEADVTTKLTQLDTVCLESVMGILELPITDKMKDNRKIILHTILKHLHSDELDEKEDKDLSVFLNL